MGISSLFFLLFHHLLVIDFASNVVHSRLLRREEHRMPLGLTNPSNSTPFNQTQFTNLGYGSQLFLADDNCPSSYLCRSPLESKSKVLPKWDELNCQCDDACDTYGDCCVNARTYVPENARTARNRFRCISLVEYGGLYMAASCPSSWTDATVRRACEDSHLEDSARMSRDPISVIPVTSLNRRITYQNAYCAACNGVVADDIVYWSPRVECEDLGPYNATYGNLTEAQVWQRLTYDETSGVWGVALPRGWNVTRRSPFSSNDSFAICRVMVQMPTTVVDLVRQCRPWVDDCPPSWTNNTVRRLCHSYTAVAYGNGDPDRSYRNVHCAMCNDEDLETLYCHGTLFYRNVNPASFAPSFALLFDINENGGAVVGTVQRCSHEGEVYDPFFKICRQLVCADPTHRLEHGRCVPPNPPTTAAPEVTSMSTNLTTTSSPTNLTTTGESVTSNGTNLDGSEGSTTSKTPLGDCGRFNISRLHYRFFGNDSIYIEEYDRVFDVHEYISKDDGSILICSPLPEDDLHYLYKRKFSLALAYLTLAGLGVSLTCLVVHLVAFMLVPSLRNLSGKNLASLCASLIAAYITFIISQFENSVPRAACASVAVVLFYSFLASFFWMNAIAFDVWRTLRLATSELRVSAGQQWRKFVAYSVYAWLGPAVIVAAALAVENSASTSVPRVFRPSFGLVTCWFGSRRALLVWFVVPVITVMLLNVLMFGLSAHIIIRTTRSSSSILRLGGGVSSNSHGGARRNFTLYWRLALIMGLSWIFGIIAGQVDQQPLWYVFVLLNTLQGLFVFLSFTCTKKVRAYLHDAVFCRGAAAGGVAYYGSSSSAAQGVRYAGRPPKKFELEGRDSAESQSSQTSQTSHLSLTKCSSQVSRCSTDTLY